MAVGVVRIFSGVHLFPRKSWRPYPFLVVALKTQAKTAALTIPTLPISPRPAKIFKKTLALPGGALTTFPVNYTPIFFLRPGGAGAPSAPSGYAYVDPF